MKKIFKISAFVMAVSMLAAVVSGCSQKAAKDEEPTLVWYMRKPISNMSSYDVVMEEANKIISKEIGAKLEFKFIESGMYDQKMNAMCSSGEAFDMCNLSGRSLLNFIDDGVFMPLDDLLSEYGSDITSQQSDLVKEGCKYKDKTYVVAGEGAMSVSRSFVFKKDLVDKYGIDYKNMNDLKSLEPYLEALKQNEPDVIPMIDAVVDKVSENYCVSDVQGVVFDENKEEFMMAYDNPEVLEEAKTKYDYYKKGYIEKDAISKTDALSEKKSGRYAVMNNEGYYSEDGSKSTAQHGFPCVESYTGNTMIRQSGPSGTCINAKSKNPEKCMQLLNLIWKDEYLLNTLAYGVEGVNYTVNEERSQEIGSKSINVKSGAEQTWAVWHNWLGPLFDQWDSSWNTVEVLNTIKENNKTAKISKSSGFVFDTNPVKAEVAKVTATYQSVYRIFQIGCMEDFDTYLEDTRSEMKTSGVEKVIAEMNKQYKEWKNNESSNK